MHVDLGESGLITNKAAEFHTMSYLCIPVQVSSLVHAMKEDKCQNST